jgi:hypothetical protein
MRVFGRDQALVDQFLHMAVIAGELLELAIAQPVNAAVTHPQAGALIFVSQQHHHRAADGAMLVALGRFLAQAPIHLYATASRTELQEIRPVKREWTVSVARFRSIIWLAISPASCPPMPSATAHKAQFRHRQASILVDRPDHADMTAAGG